MEMGIKNCQFYNWFIFDSRRIHGKNIHMYPLRCTQEEIVEATFYYGDRFLVNDVLCLTIDDTEGVELPYEEEVGSPPVDVVEVYSVQLSENTIADSECVF